MAPDGWRIERFGNMATFRNGLNYNQTDTGRAIKIIGVPHFSQYTEISEKTDINPLQIDCKISCEDLLKTGDILFVRSNGNKKLIGRSIFFSSVSEPLCFSGFTIRARVDSKTILPEFAASVVRSKNVRAEFSKHGGGTNISNLSQRILADTELLLPPLPEQRKIAEILSTWDRAIETTERLLANTTTQKRALMQQLLTGKRRFPGRKEKWASGRLGDRLAVLKDGTHFSPQSKTGPRKYITSKNVRFGKIDLSDVSYISENEHQQIFRSSPVKKGDVLLTKDGANAGNAAVNPLEEEFSLLSSVAILDGKAEQLDNSFLLQLILSPLGQNKIKAEISGQAITRLTLTQIGSIVFAFPPIEEQRQIADALSSWDTVLENTQSALTSLHTEKRALMQQLLTGKRRVTV